MPSTLWPCASPGRSVDGEPELARRLFELSLLAQDEAQRAPGLAVAGVARERRAEPRLRPVEVALETQRETEVVLVRGIVARPTRRLLELSDRLVHALPLREELAEREPQLGPGGIELDRLPELLLRLVEVGGLREASPRPVAVPEVHAEVVSRVRERRSRLDDLAQEPDRSVPIPELDEDDAQPVTRLHRSRLEPQRRLERGDGFSSAARAVEDDTEVEVRLGPARIEANGFPEGLGGGVGEARLAEGHSERVAGHCVLGIRGHRGPKLDEGGGNVALREEGDAAVATARRRSFDPRSRGGRGRRHSRRITDRPPGPAGSPSHPGRCGRPRDAARGPGPPRAPAH